MNPVFEHIIFSVVLPLALAIFLIIIKRFLNRFLPLSKTGFLYYLFSISAGFFLFLLLTGMDVNQHLRQTGYAIFTFLTILLVIRCINIWFKQSYLPNHRELQIPFLLIDIFRWLLLAGFLFVVLKIYFKISLTGIFATSAVATAIIGFALQDILGNFFAGITLNMEIPFRKGNWVEVNKNTGEVVSMTWRATKIKTIEGNFVIIPNANIAAENIINYSVHDRVLARYVSVGVHYRYPPRLIKDVIKKAALSTEGVLRTPEPIVMLIRFDDFSITYRCKFWIKGYPNLYRIEDAVQSKIWYFFKENNIEIPFPIRTIYSHRVAPEKQMESAPIATILREIEIFSPLTKQEITTLAEKFILGYFTRGERLIQQGEEGTTFFIIKEGRVSVNVQVGEAIKKIKELEAGDFFGEMSLLTDEKRSATIIAEDETEVLILDRNDFAHILKRKPAIAERLSKILAQRKLELGEYTETEKKRTKLQESREQRSILKKIKSIFDLKKRK
jgi:small-conductance mechanosensitive channel/CRP-like cAMP-binding protein